MLSPSTDTMTEEVVGGQHDQARLLLGQGEDIAGAFREPPAAHAGKLAALNDLGVVGEIPGRPNVGEAGRDGRRRPLW